MGKATRHKNREQKFGTALSSRSDTISTSQPRSDLLAKLTRSRGWLILAIFILSLGIRLSYLSEEKSSPFFSVRGTDAVIYHSRAQGLLMGTWPGHAAFELRPPGYPVFLAGVYAVFGSNIETVKLFQMFLGAITCVFVFLIAEQIFGGLRIPTLAALLCAFNGILIFYDGQLLSGCLDVFLTLATLLLLLKAQRNRHLTILFFVGLLIGLSIINRGWILLFLPFAILWLWLSSGGMNATGNDELLAESSNRIFRTNPVVQCFIVIGATMLPLIPIAWHNAKYDLPPENNKSESNIAYKSTMQRLVRGQFVLPAAGGINFYIGNHWDWRNFNDSSIDDAAHFVDFERLREEPLRLYNIKSTSEKNAYFMQKTFDMITKNPWSWIQLTGRKAFQYINGREIPRAVTVYAYRQYSYILSGLVWKKWIAFPSGIVIPLGVIGLFLALRSWKQHFPVMTLLAVHFGFLLLFFVTARYRLAVIPLFSIYAAYCISTLVDLFKARQLKSLTIILSFVVIVGIISNFQIGEMPDHNPHEYNMLGVALYGQRNLPAAVSVFQKALAANPKHAESHRNLGLAFAEMGQRTTAIEHYQKAIQFDSEFVSAFHDLGVLYLIEKRLPESIAALQRTVELAPMQWDAHLNLAAAYYQSKQYDLAVQHAQKVVEHQPDDSQAHYNMARILLALNRNTDARFHLEETLRLNPADKRAKEWLDKLTDTIPNN